MAKQVIKARETSDHDAAKQVITITRDAQISDVKTLGLCRKLRNKLLHADFTRLARTCTLRVRLRSAEASK
jgi:hypothetical protein